jgi:signal transduction histidine kinase/ActR/RegA family two-component response regulator
MTPEGRNRTDVGIGAEQSELQRTVALLLSTQQDLIRSRQQRDRERRVLDGIVRFSERAASLEGLGDYWETVVEECASSFECESAIVLEESDDGFYVLAKLGPGPEDAVELEALRAAAQPSKLQAEASFDAGASAGITFGGEPTAALLLAPIGSQDTIQRRILVAALSADKRPFFPPLDHRSAPGLRLFANCAQSLFEMLLARRQTAEQLAALDRSHRALAESESQYRQLFEGSADGLALCASDDGTLLDCNRALTALVGCTRADLIGKPAPWATPKAPDSTPTEGELRTTAGVVLPIEVRCASSVRFIGRDSKLYVLRDISRRRKAEQEQTRLQDQLMQARKMESIGRLAGGVAHDFNNLLTVIGGCGELLQTSQLEESQQQLLGEMLNASRRAQSLTQQLLTFSRKQLIRPVPSDLTEQTHAAIDMYRRLLGEDISLEFVPCGQPTPILADPQQIDQVVGNLLINARDAIHAVGSDGPRRICVRTSIVEDPLGARARGLYAQIAVEDTGVGIDEATRQNLFEPFFTTKDSGKGTGLGLATVFGIVQQNHGTIEVQSAKGQGATFLVSWPLRAGAQAQPDSAKRQGSTAGREIILLVEDDRGVREFAAQALRTYGYDVRAASGAEEAMATLDAGVQPSILVTDVVMPKTNGRVLAEMVRARMPRIPVLFISGYTDDIIAQHGVLRDGVELLEKPFGITEFAQRIRRMLDASRSPC